VIEPRTHQSQTTYKSWIRRIGKHTYRFKIMVRTDGQWEIRVDMSLNRVKGWHTVHHWNGEDAIYPVCTGYCTGCHKPHERI